ncbi:hypothetical protein O4H61_16325 [Roseovarius aestuarii]|nr:hypothetical protein [Roseovarius aestuarii]
MFKLSIDHPDRTGTETVLSTCEVTLRVLGRDHHRAAIIKPDLTLTDSYGKTLATMDEWATDWTEAGQ